MNTKGQNSKQKGLHNDTLVEALRDLGSGTAKSLGSDFFKRIPQDVYQQTGLAPQPKKDPFSGETSSFFEERKNFQERVRQTEFVRKQEKLIFTSRERETRTQVAVLIEEAKKLSVAVERFDQEVAVTAFQAPVEPGIYHINFFQKLISFIKSLTQKIDHASVWISTSTSKNKRRSYYWNQVNKSGTKFMLSQERYMSTQAG